MKFKKEKAMQFQKRAIQGKTRMTQEEKESLKALKQRRRNAYENKNKGNYERIYPSEEFKPADFERFFKGAT
jgi:hypothetical protein